jgi:hypothetical protein
MAGLLGVSQQVVDAIEGRKMPLDFCDPERAPARHLYSNPPVEEGTATENDREIDREVVWEAFVKVGREGIARTNRLTAKENEELFQTPVLDRVIELVLVGLSRLRPDLPRRPIGGALGSRARGLGRRDRALRPEEE